MKVFSLEQLLKFDDRDDLIHRIKQGFVAYSKGQVNMPPVCHMHFEKPLGDLHIKCASKIEDEFYVVKIASCFPENKQLNEPSIKGMLLLFSRQTGEPIALFLDEGHLTHLRTAIAGAICAEYLGPESISSIGIIGTGVQARFQLQLLRHVTKCRKVWVFGRDQESMKVFQQDDSLKDFEIHLAQSACEVTKNCRLIVTTTPSLKPILLAQDIYPGTHITAVGSDRPGKVELDPQILKIASRVVVDSRSQCLKYGEAFNAMKAGFLSLDKIEEIGEVIAYGKTKRTDDEITVADLTGLGVQDLEIAKAFYQFLAK